MRDTGLLYISIICREKSISNHFFVRMPGRGWHDMSFRLSPLIRSLVFNPVMNHYFCDSLFKFLLRARLSLSRLRREWGKSGQRRAMHRWI